MENNPIVDGIMCALERMIDKRIREILSDLSIGDDAVVTEDRVKEIFESCVESEDLVSEARVRSAVMDVIRYDIEFNVCVE